MKEYSFERKYISPLFILAGFILISQTVYGQTQSGTTFTLEQCIAYALKNDFKLRESKIDEEIGEYQIKASLSAWLPQVISQYNYAYSFKLQTTAFGDNLFKIGRKNNSNILFQANQVIYNNDVLLASRAAGTVRLQLDQNTEATRINTIVNVSKSFYDVLLTKAQLRILEENIVRQNKQYKDAYSRYEFGLVDKTDYQQASITLANTKSDKKRAQESLKAKYVSLKQLMAYPMESDFTLAFDSTQMESIVLTDTLQTVNYPDRIEFQQALTTKRLLHLNTVYNKLGIVPSVSAFANYNLLYFNNDFSKLYSQSFPTSQSGITVSMPLFLGTRRIQNIRMASLREERSQIDIENTQYTIYTEYQTALANYKSNYNEWLTVKQNVIVAREVYGIVKLQYDEGIKAYLDLLVAETAVKASELNYFSALYNLVASKIDLERALGNIK